MANTISPSIPSSGAPTSIPNLMSWFMADSGVYNDVAGTTLATNGQGCANWGDLSGNAYNITQSASGQRPIYTTGVQNNLPILRFDSASSQFLANTSSLITFSGPLTHFAVISLDWDSTFNGSKCFYSSGDLGGTTGYNVSWDGRNANDWLQKSITVFGNGFDPGVAPRTLATHGQTGASGFRVVETVCGSHGGLWINGVQRTPTVCSAGFPVGRSGLYIGKSGASFTGYYLGDIGENICYDRALSNRERVLIRTYLGKKWGIAVTSS